MVDLPSNSFDPPINENFMDEHLFLISFDNPWYEDILVYIPMNFFFPQLSRDDRSWINHQASLYLLIGEVLYQRGINIILRRCITIEEIDKVLNDCHSGECGGHYFGISTIDKIVRVGYFCPTQFHDCIHAIKRCQKCQLYDHKSRAPPSLHLVITIDPCCKWGIDFMTCNPHPAMGTCILWSFSTTLPNGNNPCPL